jgi:tripeptide aminopeptidase
MHMPKTLAERTAATMMELIAIHSPSYHEEHARKDLVVRLKDLGIEVEIDGAGNVLGTLGATKGLEKEPLVLLNCHMDTVPNAVNAKPFVQDGVVATDGSTALGADDKAGIAAILEAVRVMEAEQKPHGPILLLFTVAEEVGLEGAKAFDMDRLRSVKRGYTLDASGSVGTVITRAPAKSDAKVVFHGKAAHAGFTPEKGINAISMAARAIDNMRLLRIDGETTANVGTIRGGEVTNIVCDRCEVTLEVRSTTSERVQQHLTHLELCCIKAIGAFGGSYEFDSVELYPGYVVPADAPELEYFAKVCKKANIPYNPVPTGGGSDANIMRNKGLPVITLGIGYSGAHSTSESIPMEALGTLTHLVGLLCAPESTLE